MCWQELPHACTSQLSSRKADKPRVLLQLYISRWLCYKNVVLEWKPKSAGQHPQNIYIYPDNSSTWSSVLVCLQDVSNTKFNQLNFKQCYSRKQYCHPLISLCNFSFSRGLPHSHTLTPTHALIWPQEKPVTVSGPLPREDKLPVMTTTFCGIHIRGKTKEVLRSRGITLKLFILCFLLPSPLCLSPTLFCQLITRAAVSLPSHLEFLGWIVNKHGGKTPSEKLMIDCLGRCVYVNHVAVWEGQCTSPTSECHSIMKL